MDPVVLQLLARIKIRLRQAKGVAINTQRFFSDQDYATQVLDAAEDCEDIELVTASLEIRNKLGWIPLNSLQPAPPAHAGKPSQNAPKSSAPSGRYMFGARS